MTNEEKQQSLARARALLEELADMPPYEPAAENVHRTARNLAYEPVEDELTRWKREALEDQARRDAVQMQTTTQLNAARTKDWEQWADARIACALAEHDRITIEATGAAMAEYVGKKLAKLEARLDALERKQRGLDDGDVVDLPSPLLRKRHDAA